MTAARKPTAVAILRLSAPTKAPARQQEWASITQGDVVTFLRRNGLHRDQVTISDFERAKYRGPDEFVRLYAQAIGKPVAAVEEAWKEERRVWLRKAKAEDRAGR